MSRDMVYFELMDRMQNNCCPICEQIKKRTLQSMDGFLYESVNDPSIRKELNASRGLCNYHSHLLLSMGDPLSHAIVYGDLIEVAIHDAEKEHYLPYDEHAECRYCKSEAEAEATYAAAFLDGYSEKEFQEKYVSDGILCMSHLHSLQIIAEKNRQENTYRLIKRATLDKYQGLLTCLSEIRRKNDYRYSAEGWTEDEKAAWKRVVGVINGLSGNHRFN